MVGTILRGNVYLLSDYYKQVYRNDEFWASIAQQPRLPDRDTIASNAWSEAYSRGLTSSLEDEERDAILRPPELHIGQGLSLPPHLSTPRHEEGGRDNIVATRTGCV